MRPELFKVTEFKSRSSRSGRSAKTARELELAPGRLMRLSTSFRLKRSELLAVDPNRNKKLRNVGANTPSTRTERLGTAVDRTSPVGCFVEVGRGQWEGG